MDDSAAVERGREQLEQKQVDAAAATWETVVEGGDPDAAPVATELLASLRLYHQDRPAQAEAEFLAAIESRHPKAAPRALAGLAELRRREGRRDEALSLAEQADAMREEDDLRAAELVAIALDGLDRLDRAAELWEEVIRGGEPKRVPQALVCLAWIRGTRGDQEGAEKLLVRAVETKHPVHAGQAAYTLGWLRESEGRREEAAEAYRLAVQLGEPTSARDAARALRRLSWPWRLFQNLWPSSVFLTFLVPDGWPRGVGFSAYVVLLAFTRLRGRRMDAATVSEFLLLAVAAVGLGLEVAVSRPRTLTDPGLIVVLVVLFVAVVVPPLARRMNERKTS